MSAGPPTGGPEERRDVLKYTFLRLRPEWRLRPREEREPAKSAALRLLESPPEGTIVRTYSLVGTKAGPEMLLWAIAPNLEPVQELHARLLGTPLGPYLETTHSYLGMAKRSEYLGEHAHEGQEEGTRRPVDRPYLFVYPFVKKRSWYGLPFAERQKMMGEHFRIGHQYPDIAIHTGYSFGLDDPEFILGFEADDPGRFLDLVHDLRGSEVSRYTELETPIFTCLAASPRRMLDLADGLP
ncbi:MAG: chlorite dismutase family protein [Thermoplasmata archaeon]|nr:chlorite dismutase family protein [Thermoplasmata archaeon]